MEVEDSKEYTPTVNNENESSSLSSGDSTSVEMSSLDILTELFEHKGRNCFLEQCTEKDLIQSILLFSNRTPCGRLIRESNEYIEEVMVDDIGDIALPPSRSAKEYSPILLREEDVLEVLHFYSKNYTSDITKSTTTSQNVNQSQTFPPSPCSPIEEEFKEELKLFPRDSNGNMTPMSKSTFSRFQSVYRQVEEQLINEHCEHNNLLNPDDDLHKATVNATNNVHPYLSTFLFFYNGRWEFDRWGLFSDIYIRGPLSEKMIQLLVSYLKRMALPQKVNKPY